MKAEKSKSRQTFYCLIAILLSVLFLVYSLDNISPRLEAIKVGSIKKNQSIYCLKIDTVPISIIETASLNENVISVSAKGVIYVDKVSALSFIFYTTFGPGGKLNGLKFETEYDGITYSIQEMGTDNSVIEYLEKKGDQLLLKKVFSIKGPLLLSKIEEGDTDRISFYLPEKLGSSYFSLSSGILKAISSVVFLEEISNSSVCNVVPLSDLKRGQDIESMYHEIKKTIEILRAK